MSQIFTLNIKTMKIILKRIVQQVGVHRLSRSVILTMGLHAEFHNVSHADLNPTVKQVKQIEIPIL